MISTFCKTYLQAQGVYVYPEIKQVTKPVPKREEIFVPVAPEYERQ